MFSGIEIMALRAQSEFEQAERDVEGARKTADWILGFNGGSNTANSVNAEAIAHAFTELGTALKVRERLRLHLGDVQRLQKEEERAREKGE